MNGGNMNPDTLGLLSNVLNIALVLFALWIAGRIVLRNLSLLQNNVASGRPIQLAIWLALGGLFTIPLFDLLRIFHLFDVWLMPSFEAGEFVTLWGSVPWFVYDACIGLTMLIIYGNTLKMGWKPLFKRDPPILESIQINSFERVFILCTIAGLANNIVLTVLYSIIWSQSPLEIEGIGKGIAGFFAGWLTSLLIVAIAIYVMSEFIARKEDEFLEIDG
jgi:hypothetical protein